ncbi:TPA: hypothetical protein SMF86_003122 [Serratia marcescens]|nr:hypothetical protein [Serratia marcescens]HEJ9047778.1 hypothetical protein [Serratia marcescens]
MEKLSELSKPVGFVSKLAQTFLECGETASIRPFFDVQGSSPLHSQEYVSALQQKIAELEQAMRHIHGAALDITVPRAAIAKVAELAVEHAAMKEHSNG